MKFVHSFAMDSCSCALCASVVNCFALDREAFTFTSYDLNVRSRAGSAAAGRSRQDHYAQ